ncbi:MAG TPA: hypothetical protein VGE01_09470, partial [Fimbriimonas sp.]
MDFAFDALAGTVYVNAEAPGRWEHEGLGEFYANPNGQAWGNRLCRVLYHETTHFWQLLGSSYLADVVMDDWERVVAYEQSGKTIPGPAKKREYTAPTSHGFSAHMLAECWARYWDVHTRSPATIAREEDLSVAGVLQGPLGYSSAAFDAVMTEGKDSKCYGAPYRALLDQFLGHSAYAAYCFPIIVYWAFNSPDPVGAYMRMIGQAWASGNVRAALEARTGSINVDWFRLRGVLEEALDPPPPGGMLGQSPALAAHPLYAEYENKLVDLSLVAAQLLLRTREPASVAELELYDSLLACQSQQDFCFMLPGQPNIRYAMGKWLEPSAVQFSNLAVYGRRSQAGEGSVRPE